MAGKSKIVKLYDVNGQLFWDEKCGFPFCQNLYQSEESENLYIDKDLTFLAHIVSKPVTDDNSKPVTVDSSKPVTVDSNKSRPTPDGPSTSYSPESQITHNQTLYLIETMRDYIESEEDPPKDFKELQNRIDRGRGNKKLLWQEISDKIKKEFGITLEIKKISRKWQTLVDGYKKAKDKNSKTGNAPTRFKYYEEMDLLLKDRHDINIPVKGTAEEIIVNNEVIKEKPKLDNSGATRKRKGDSLIEYLRDSDAAAAKRQDKLIEQLNENQKTIIHMFSALIKK